MITEGGNVFKDAQGVPVTQRIAQSDVPATISYLEKILGMKLPKENWLGSTGRAATSGDLDIAIDVNKTSKDDIAAALTKFVQSQNQDPRDFVVKKGEVHFKTPIRGDAKNGFVQTDFMFLPNIDWGTFYYAGGEDSAYKGMYRNVLMSSIAKSLGLKVGLNGVFSRTSNDLVSKDPDWTAQALLGAGHDRNSLKNVETIYAALEKDPKRSEKLADFRDYLKRAGIQEPNAVKESETHFLARLRDRIVNQGMQPIMEGVRIEHPEDLVFSGRPSDGVVKAIQGLEAAANNPQETTIKWDGKPAIIFGRKPNGEFVLTDKGGFLAKGYDGLATSPEMMSKILAGRKGGGREDLAALYARLFPILRKAVPQNFKGYIQGDLLYSTQPAKQNNNWVFQPNTVRYTVPVNSTLGQQIAKSEVGVVIHTQLDQPGGTATPIRAAELTAAPGLLILDPSMRDTKKIKINDRAMKELKSLGSRYSNEMDRLFNPAELRNRRISNLPELIKQFINSRVREGNYNNLVQEFGKWVEQKAPTKAPRIFEWANENKRALAAVFQTFLTISAIKNDIVRQLDAQSQDVQASIDGEAGHEGYVGQGLKFVDRMRFSQANFALNNPNLS